MSETTFDHEFEAEDACGTCGLDEMEPVHDSDREDEFDHEFETADVCSVCGSSEADEQHQTE